MTTELATFGMGGFWHANEMTSPEGRLRVFGYMGGEVERPSPEQVEAGGSGHVAVIQIEFDPDEQSYEFLLLRFWAFHDPTEVPPDGHPSRHHLRSVIFFHTTEQEAIARAWVANPYAALQTLLPAELASRRASVRPILTEVKPASTLWPAPASFTTHLPTRRHMRRHVEVGPRVVGQLDLVDGPVLAPGSALDVPPGFAGHVDPTELREYFVDDDHIAAVWKAMDRSLAGRSAEVRDLAVANSAISTSHDCSDVRLRWAWDDVDHTFVVNRQPGCFSSWPNSEDSGALRVMVEPPPGASELVLHSGFPSKRPAGFRALTADFLLGESLQSATIAPWSAGPDAGESWTEFVPPVHLELDVGGRQPHTVEWRAGALELGDHRGSFEDELTLSVLANDAPCPCLLLPVIWSTDWLRQRWYQQPLVGRLLPVLAHSAIERLNPPNSWDPDHGLLPYPELDEKPRADAVRDVDWWPEKPSTRLAAFRYAMRRIEQLPDALFERWLVAGLVDMDERRRELSYLDRANLSTFALAPLRHAISATVIRSSRAEASIRYTHLVCKLLEPGASARVEAFVDDESDTAHVSVSVPLAWLYTVWLRGLSVVDGLLVLSVVGPTDAEIVDAEVVAWQRDGNGHPPRLSTANTKLAWDGEQWHIAGRCG